MIASTSAGLTVDGGGGGVVVVGVVDAVDVLEAVRELVVLVEVTGLVGEAVVGEAVVGAGGGGGIMAPAGRQIDRPG